MKLVTRRTNPIETRRNKTAPRGNNIGQLFVKLPIDLWTCCLRNNLKGNTKEKYPLRSELLSNFTKTYRNLRKLLRENYRFQKRLSQGTDLHKAAEERYTERVNERLGQPSRLQSFDEALKADLCRERPRAFACALARNAPTELLSGSWRIYSRMHHRSKLRAVAPVKNRRSRLVRPIVFADHRRPCRWHMRPSPLAAGYASRWHCDFTPARFSRSSRAFSPSPSATLSVTVSRPSG